MSLRYFNLKLKVLASCGEVTNPDDSIWWKDLLLNDIKAENNDVNFSSCVQCKTNRGNNILFWHNSWLGNQAFCSIFPDLFDLSTSKLCSIEEALARNSGAVKEMFPDSEDVFHQAANSNLPGSADLFQNTMD